MSNIIPLEKIENKIYLIRSQKVMLDSDLAEIYGVETRVLNQAVKRNIDRFPGDFMFSLSRNEINNLSQIVISSNIKHSPNVNVFTEHGVAMLSSVLKSKKAIEMNIAIVRVFIKIRRMADSYKDLANKIEKLEKNQTIQGKSIKEIFQMINCLTKSEEKENKKEIGFKSK